MKLSKYRPPIFKKMRNAVRVLAQPGKAYRHEGKYVIQPFRGYGARHEAFVMGRVFRQHRVFPDASEDSVSSDLAAIWRRLSRKGLSGADLSARFYDATALTRSDKHGFFRLRIQADQPVKGGPLWQPVDIRFKDGLRHEPAVRAEVFFPPETARFVVISDIDDTVIHTGVANKIRMLWRLFVQRTQSRTAFPGVAAFYRALHHGASGNEFNPMLYVSRGPWAIYEILEEFFNLHRIPVGPILFLRYWGLDIHHPLPHRSKAHKIKMIRTMLRIYDDLPFILIGDSGQKDPEIYAQIVSEHPGRVEAIYIRDIDLDPQRRKAIEQLGERVIETGSRLLVSEDSFAMAEHAADKGYISSASLGDILAKRSFQEQGKIRGANREIDAVNA